MAVVLLLVEAERLHFAVDCCLNEQKQCEHPTMACQETLLDKLDKGTIDFETVVVAVVVVAVVVVAVVAAVVVAVVVVFQLLENVPLLALLSELPTVRLLVSKEDWSAISSSSTDALH